MTLLKTLRNNRFFILPPKKRLFRLLKLAFYGALWSSLNANQHGQARSLKGDCRISAHLHTHSHKY